MKYGIYDLASGRVVCDPLDDRQRLLDILSRRGVDVSQVVFDGVQQFHNTLVLPSIDEKPASPKALGYDGQLTQWSYDESRSALARTIVWSSKEFASFESQLYEHLEKEEARALRLVKLGYTDEAVETWSQQRYEADLWLADNTAEVVMISSMATQRGITVAEMVEKINTKAEKAALATGLILGSVQAAGDRIESLKSEEELPADWFDQLQSIADTWQANWPSELLGG